ncbi:MAG: 30S ribosomal protein S6--L-glutamate ligase, partial [Anaerolineaceae bacterium]|nr:30S ribosomal protein S6--L-glutamate ligase [Anaerolineaceae bacterium]
MMKIGILLSRVRVEEKWLLSALESRHIAYERIDDGQVSFRLDDPTEWNHFDAVLERSVSYASGLYSTSVLNSWGIPTVNTSAVA